MMSLNGKIALITGASRGIGEATALALAQKGATVIGTATSESGAADIDHYLKSNNFTGTGKVLNVTDENSRNLLYEAVKSEFGVVDILINNAGITRDTLMLRMNAKDWLDVIETNLNSVFHMTKLFLRDMVKARWGRIISVSSIVGFTGNPGQVNYAAAKAGIVGFTKTLAQEVAIRGITVNAVAPGFVDTRMTQALNEEQKAALLKMIPMQRIGDPEDIAYAIAFLASPEASYITGHTLHVNGGMFMT